MEATYYCEDIFQDIMHQEGKGFLECEYSHKSQKEDRREREKERGRERGKKREREGEKD
jgi:hypothetical protein